MSRHVRERFPEYEMQIAGLYAEDHEFRGICHDYGVCVEELRKAFESPRPQNSQQRTEQLRELRSDLEAELLEYLNGRLPQTSSSRR